MPFPPSLSGCTAHADPSACTNKCTIPSEADRASSQAPSENGDAACGPHEMPYITEDWLTPQGSSGGKWVHTIWSACGQDIIKIRYGYRVAEGKAYGKIVKSVGSSDSDDLKRRCIFLLSKEDFQQRFNAKVRGQGQGTKATISYEEALKMARQVIITQWKKITPGPPPWANQHYQDTVVKRLESERKWASYPDWDDEYE